MKKWKNIGIFINTFDPFTKAHQAIVEAVLDQKLVDEVNIVPTAANYYKNKTSWLDMEQRVSVIQEIIWRMRKSKDDRYDHIHIDDCDEEFVNDNAPYVVNKRTYMDTLHQFIDSKNGCVPCCVPQRPGSGYYNEYYTIIGFDVYKILEKWSDCEELLNLSKLIVVNTHNEENIQSDIPKIDLKIDPKYSDVTSAKIREQYMNKTWDEYVDDTF